MKRLRRLAILWFLVYLSPALSMPSASVLAQAEISNLRVLNTSWYEMQSQPITNGNGCVCLPPVADDSTRHRYPDGRGCPCPQELDCYSVGLSPALWQIPSTHREYLYEVKIKNTSVKIVAAIEWEYLFIEPDTGQVLGRHSFTTLQRIKPGERKTLRESSVSQPFKVISVASLRQYANYGFEERIEIQSVIYADGSVWQKPQLTNVLSSPEQKVFIVPR
jgi:hypothetical protein